LLEERLYDGPLDGVVENRVNHVVDEVGFHLREAKKGLSFADFEEGGAGDLLGFVF